MRRARGYAYLFVLMTVALMGVGLSVAAEVYWVSARRDQEKELLFIGRQFRDAIGGYYEASPGGQRQYPDSLEVLLKDKRMPGTRRYLRKIYIDPLTGKAEWGVVRVAGRIVGVHSLSREAVIKVGNFGLSEAAFEGKGKYTEWVFTYPQNLIIKKVAPENIPSISAIQPPDGFPRAEQFPRALSQGAQSTEANANLMSHGELRDAR